MMKLACKDVDSASTCDYEATGNTVVEVAGKMMEHAKTNHPEGVKGMGDNDIMEMMESKVHA